MYRFIISRKLETMIASNGDLISVDYDMAEIKKSLKETSATIVESEHIQIEKGEIYLIMICYKSTRTGSGMTQVPM